MERFSQLLLNVWREACRHLEIGEAVALSAPALFQRIPVDLVLIRRFDIGRRLVETVATGLCRPGPQPDAHRSELPAAQFDRLLAWCRQNEVVLSTLPELGEIPAGALPTGIHGDVLVGPLNTAEGPIGIVIFVARQPRHFQQRHTRVLRILLEPFTVWVENDRRQRELKVLREAAEADNRSLLSRLGKFDISDSVIGAEAGLKHVMERVEQVARTDVPVLILGETGSGKEVVARAIHQQSGRTKGPFLRVNCGAIAPELVDSELFGHERGSFTGAVGQRKGWFERADGGTLLLDECGELTLAAQVRLLRILQDGTFERVGGESQQTVDVRIIAATHRDLETMVADGRFREDLWYRLSIFPLRLPPLRQRVEDIPAMAAHFVKKSAQRLGLSPQSLTRDDLDLLVSYPWPGNVRELSAVMERAVILGDGKRLDVAKALGPLPGRPANDAPSPPAVSTLMGAPAGSQEFIPLETAMARHIEAALVRTHGRIEGPFGAARILQINPHTLRGRMRSLGLDWKKFRRPD